MDSVENALKYLEKIYKDPSNPVSFGSAANVYRYLKGKGYTITLKEI